MSFKNQFPVNLRQSTKRLPIHLLSCFVYVIFAGLAVAETRTWTSLRGDTLEGELISVRDDVLMIRGATGELKVPVKSISLTDRDYVWEWMTERALKEKNVQYPLPRIDWLKSSGSVGGDVILFAGSGGTGGSLGLNPGRSTRMASPILVLPYFYDSSDLNLLVLSAHKGWDKIEDILKKNNSHAWKKVGPVPKKELAAASSALQDICREAFVELRVEDPIAVEKQVAEIVKAMTEIKKLYYVRRLLYTADPVRPSPLSKSPESWKHTLEVSDPLWKLRDTDPRILSNFWHPDSDFSRSSKAFSKQLSDIDVALEVVRDTNKNAVVRKSRWEALRRQAMELAAVVDSWQKSTSLWHLPLEIMGYHAHEERSHEYYIELKAGGTVIYSKTIR